MHRRGECKFGEEIRRQALAGTGAPLLPTLFVSHEDVSHHVWMNETAMKIWADRGYEDDLVAGVQQELGVDLN